MNVYHRLLACSIPGATCCLCQRGLVPVVYSSSNNHGDHAGCPRAGGRHGAEERASALWRSFGSIILVYTDGISDSRTGDDFFGKGVSDTLVDCVGDTSTIAEGYQAALEFSMVTWRTMPPCWQGQAAVTECDRMRARRRTRSISVGVRVKGLPQSEIQIRNPRFLSLFRRPH